MREAITNEWIKDTKKAMKSHGLSFLDLANLIGRVTGTKVSASNLRWTLSGKGNSSRFVPLVNEALTTPDSSIPNMRPSSLNGKTKSWLAIGEMLKSELSTEDFGAIMRNLKNIAEVESARAVLLKH